MKVERNNSFLYQIFLREGYYPIQRNKSAPVLDGLAGVRTFIDSSFETCTHWVAVFGCFDLTPDNELHEGHRALLQTLAYDYQLKPVVLVDSDETVWYNKGFWRPHVPQEQRCEKLSQLAGVALVGALDDIVQYSSPYYGSPDGDSLHRYEERLKILKPEMVAINAEDELNPYPYSLYAMAGRCGMQRLMYCKLSGHSTTKSWGY